MSLAKKRHRSKVFQQATTENDVQNSSIKFLNPTWSVNNGILDQIEETSNTQTQHKHDDN
jgi:hypothetical protein